MTRVVLALAAFLGWAAYAHLTGPQKRKLYGTQPDAFPFPTSDARRDIDLEDAASVRDWCHTFTCTEEQLRAAVRGAGRAPTSVRDHLSRTR